MSLFDELKRRNVFRVAFAYIIVAWLVLQVSDTLSPALHLPEWFHSAIALLLILGFPIAVLFAWAFELTPEGVKLEREVDRSQSITNVTGRKLDYTTIALLSVAVIYFAVDKFGPSEEPAAVAVEESAPDRSIAVLPFVNMSDDTANEYFADGITEELLNLLAKIPELHVTSRSSAFTFKNQSIDIPTIAAQLNVAHILEGSVRKSGDQVRITAQLIQADGDKHLWSETFDRELVDIFRIQDEISKEVVDALHVALLGEPPKAKVTDPRAYALYLEANHYIEIDDEESLTKALDLLDQAIDIDPNYASLWAKKARALRSQANYGFIDLHAGTESARQAILHALEIDPESAQALAALAYIQFVYDWEWEQARGTIRRAQAIDPVHFDVLEVASVIERSNGNLRSAIKLAEQAMSRDPLGANAIFSAGFQHWILLDFDEAERLARRNIELHPEQMNLMAPLAMILYSSGRAEESLAYIDELQSEMFRRNHLAMAYAIMGDERAEEARQTVIDNYSDILAYQIAEAYALRGMPDEAFEWLDESIEIRDGGITHLPYDMLLTGLHDDPRWRPLLRKVGLEEAHDRVLRDRAAL